MIWADSDQWYLSLHCLRRILSAYLRFHLLGAFYWCLYYGGCERKVNFVYLDIHYLHYYNYYDLHEYYY